MSWLIKKVEVPNLYDYTDIFWSIWLVLVVYFGYNPYYMHNKNTLKMAHLEVLYLNIASLRQAWSKATIWHLFLPLLPVVFIIRSVFKSEMCTFRQCFLNYVCIDVVYILLSCLFLNIQLNCKLPLSPVLMLFCFPISIVSYVPWKTFFYSMHWHKYHRFIDEYLPTNLQHVHQCCFIWDI